MSSSVSFAKLQALGNDFMLVDARQQRFDPDPELIRGLADRRLGIGFDQLLILEPPTSEQALCSVRIRNSDGSAAEQCGNGMRAIALWLNEQGLLHDHGQLDTDGGSVEITFQDSRNITASLAPPVFTPPDSSPLANGRPWQEAIDGERCNIDYVELGNPHLIVDLAQQPSASLVADAGATLTRHSALKHGANINFAFVTSQSHVELSVFERGVGPTPACGSGACATAVSLIRRELVRSPVIIDQPGGRLVINWSGRGAQVRMTGPARHVFDGRFVPGHFTQPQP